MTLKEKINDALFYIEPKVSITKCEQIAEEFAIGFAEWINLNCDEFLETDQQVLLRVYKKEKGL